MTNQEIYELLARFESSSIRTLRLSNGTFSIELSKDGSGPAPSSAASGAPVQEAGPAVPAGPADNAIASPLAGVFYAASQPGAKPFVQAGDRVNKGDTVCLVEAMKTISEIPAPCDCIITAVLKDNGALAAFDEPLMRYRPC